MLVAAIPTTPENGENEREERIVLRAARDEVELHAAEVGFTDARLLMVEALTLIDASPVVTESGSHLDLAVHMLTDAIAKVKGGADIFADELFGFRADGSSSLL